MSEPDRLSTTVLQAIEDPENEVLFSAASIWEIAIKAALRRDDFDVDVDRVLAYATEIEFRELPIRSAVAATVSSLPRVHRDPFDRLLIAQAMAEPALFFTLDGALARYTDLVRRV
jgi:PIN domain nuclease of toxin-antitoxin system